MKFWVRQIYQTSWFGPFDSLDEAEAFAAAEEERTGSHDPFGVFTHEEKLEHWS